MYKNFFVFTFQNTKNLLPEITLEVDNRIIFTASKDDDADRKKHDCKINTFNTPLRI